MTKILIDSSVLEQALKALEADNSKLWPSEKRAAAITFLRERLEQPQVEQEPVAWIYQNSNTDTEYLVWCKSEAGGRNWRPLYTHPHPPRQPLTDEQIDGLLENVIGSLPVARKLIRAIERAHGIRGEA